MDQKSLKLSEEILVFLKTKDWDLIKKQITNWSSAMWYAARFTAQAHGIAPLLYVTFNELNLVNYLDQDFYNYIKDQYLQNQQRTSRIQEILKALLCKANEKNIPIMPLKGSVLINGYYHDPALRPMADIDLLISPGNNDRLALLLESMKYQPFDSFDEGVYTNSHNLISLDGEHPDNPIKIELTQKVGWPIGHLDYDITDLIWENAERGFLDYHSVFTPTQERLLLMLICHNAGNQFNGKMRAFQLHDISLVTKRMSPQQWLAFSTFVKEYQLERIVFSVMMMAKRFTDIEIPDGLIEEQKLYTPHSLQRLVQAQSVDSLIATNDFKLLNLKLKERSNKIINNVLKIYQPIFITIVNAIQFQWFFPGKEKTQQLKRIFSLSTYKKNREGNILSYIFYYWLLLPIIYLPIFVIGNNLRDLYLRRLRVSLIRYLYDSNRPA